jgi:hypothetical protein
VSRKERTSPISITDSSCAAWLEKESARLLNPPAVYQAFFEQWQTNTAKVESLAQHRLDPGEVHRAFSSKLAAG